ncbi:MAG TPA: hypothetical protein PK743_09875, partial [Luteimonas sp.]|nr:hypothetical protein [Luteimonas sp.]
MTTLPRKARRPRTKRGLREQLFLGSSPIRVGLAGLMGPDPGLRPEVVPGRGLFPGSISHPWLTRRRSASMRC